MTITSTAFQPGEPIPAKHSLDGGNTSPPLTFSEVPVEAKSLALTVEDPDAPTGTFTHWIIYNFSPATLQIMEGQTPDTARQAKNDFGNKRYDGPKPPNGTHHYHFKLFALDLMLDGVINNRADLYGAMEGHVLDSAELVGTYET
jgi:Raf kinase inhibitor-like YbhB/YbcL family protein